MTAPIVGAPYIAGPTFPIEWVRGRRFVVRRIENITVNVLGKDHTAAMVSIAVKSRGRVVEDGFHLSDWCDAKPADKAKE